MFDPFKRARAKATKKIRRATISAMTDAWGSLLAPAKPVRRKVAKKAKPLNATPAGTNKIKLARPADESKVPATSRSILTAPPGADFKSYNFDSAYGTRSYKLYVPSVARNSPVSLPLIVMLHGCGQSSDDFARGTGMNALAEEFGFFVLYPTQSRDANLNGCWNWFKRDNQARGAGEPALIASLTCHVVVEKNADPAKVYVAGLSAGGSTALIVATAYPDIFAAVGVHSGLGVGAAHDAVSAAGAMQGGNPGVRHDAQMPTIVFHGDADKVVNPRNGRFVASRALEPYRNLDRTETTGRVVGGRDFSRIVHRVGKGRPYTELWVVYGSGHAWSGGHAAGSYTDPTGPDASRAMVRFFMKHRTTKMRRSTPPL